MNKSLMVISFSSKFYSLLSLKTLMIILIYAQLLILSFYTHLRNYANNSYFEPRSRDR